MPRPSTTTAVLFCEGRCREPTRHNYSGNEPIVRKSDHSIIGQKFMFACSVCTHVRVWGRDES